MFTADEKTRIRECYAAAFDRITNTNVKCFEGHKKAVFLFVFLMKKKLKTLKRNDIMRAKFKHKKGC